MATVSQVRLDGSIYLSSSTDTATPWDGTGTPWDNPSTTPFEIANNDVTGERWAITAMETPPILDGSPPFALRPQAIGLLPTTRQVIIPFQARATTQANLLPLLTILRRVVQRAAVGSAVSLQVEYQGGLVEMLVEGGVVQETASFWNDEAEAGVLRGVLRLTCTIGSSGSDTLIGSRSISNPSATAFLSGTGVSEMAGEWNRSFGQPLVIALQGGDIGTAGVKTVYVATTNNTADSGAISSSLVTSSTSYSTAAGSVSLDCASGRALRYRLIAQITNPDADLEVRAIVRLNNASGAVIYTGPAIAPGTSTTIVDLGYVILSQQIRMGVGGMIYAQLQYRSSTGNASAGTLVRLRILEYLTFAKITTGSTATNDKLRLENVLPIAGGGGHPAPDRALRLNSSDAVVELCPVQGQLPRAWDRASLWLAWMNDGIFDSADTITLGAFYWPLYETIGTNT